MKVTEIKTGTEYEAIKEADGSYTVGGQKFTKDEMGAKYRPVKAKAEAKAEEVMVNIKPSTICIKGVNVPALFEAIAKVSGEMKNLNKGKEAFNYKYITLGQVIDMTRKPLADNGLAVMNFPSTYVMNNQVFSRVELIVSHKEGAYISSVFDVPVNENRKQAFVQSVATIQSYCVRYHRVNLLGIAGEDDTDGK